MLNKLHIQILFSKSLFRQTLSSAVILTLVALANAAVNAQFNSGSTGADGAFNPTANITLQIPESGIFNFTTVNIPQNVQVRFTKNSRNTPVTILATGDVIIGGRIYLDGSGGNGRFGGGGGPGGFGGGVGGSPIDDIDGVTGDGPGGGGGAIGGIISGYGRGGTGGFFTVGQDGNFSGNAVPGRGGPRYGTKNLLPLIGGSGGGGGSSSNNGTTVGSGGGGGGGAILIASSTSISFPANSDTSRGILARGGSGATVGSNNTWGGGGSGGAIRLIANTISGTPCLDVSGGANININYTSYGSNGIIRIEAFDLSQYVPRCSVNEQTLGGPNPVTLTNTPMLKIVSVGGITAPANPVGSSSSLNPDITVPTSVSNPVQVAIQASNIPVGTVLQVRLIPESGVATVVTSTPLSGTTASSTATASLTLPENGISVIRAFVTLDVEVTFGNRNVFINGEKVSKVEYSSGFGGKTEIVYILKSGKRITELK